MAKVTKVLVTSTKSIADLILYVRTIMSAVATNTNFPGINNPPPTTPVPNVPTYTQMKTAVDALEAAAAKFKLTRTPSDKTARDAAKAVLDTAVTGYIPLWAAYVQSQSGTNIGLMQTSGFDLSNQPTKIDELSQPEKLRIEVYNKGMFRLSVEAVTNATGYQWSVVQIDPVTKQPVTNGIVKTPISTSRLVDVDGLTSGLWYAITCYAFASKEVVSTEANPIYAVCL